MNGAPSMLAKKISFFDKKRAFTHVKVQNQKSGESNGSKNQQSGPGIVVDGTSSVDGLTNIVAGNGKDIILEDAEGEQTSKRKGLAPFKAEHKPKKPKQNPNSKS